MAVSILDYLLVVMDKKHSTFFVKGNKPHLRGRGFEVVLVILFLSVAGLSACELPSRPNFQTEHRYTIPLINSVSYQFLGGSGAIIDTTSADFENLFSVDPDGLVRLGVEVAFSMGSLKNAIPEVQVDPLTVNSQIEDLLPDISGSAVTSFAALVSAPILCALEKPSDAA